MVSLVMPTLLLFVFALYAPADAWYKQAAGPSYYSVGRASGLLSGMRRSPLRRAEADITDNNVLSETELQHSFTLSNSPLCVKLVSPKLHSCELVHSAIYRCDAAVLITLDSTDCLTA